MRLHSDIAFVRAHISRSLATPSYVELCICWWSADTALLGHLLKLGQVEAEVVEAVTIIKAAELVVDKQAMPRVRAATSAVSQATRPETATESVLLHSSAHQYRQLPSQALAPAYSAVTLAPGVQPQVWVAQSARLAAAEAGAAPAADQVE